VFETIQTKIEIEYRDDCIKLKVLESNKDQVLTLLLNFEQAEWIAKTLLQGLPAKNETFHEPRPIC